MIPQRRICGKVRLHLTTAWEHLLGLKALEFERFSDAGIAGKASGLRVVVGKI
jgi:hypothetical protein